MISKTVKNLYLTPMNQTNLQSMLRNMIDLPVSLTLMNKTSEFETNTQIIISKSVIQIFLRMNERMLVICQMVLKDINRLSLV